MAAIDAKSNFSSSHNLVASFTDTSFTVGALANRALVVALCTEGPAPTAPTCNWDSTGTNQPMTLITTLVDNRSPQPIRIFLFGLVAPTPGLKTLAVASLGTGCDAIVAYISFTGVDQTGGATTFKNAITSAVGGGTTLTATITTKVGDVAIGMFGSSVGSATFNQTPWPSTQGITGMSFDGYNGNYAIASGSSVAITQTQVSSGNSNYAAFALASASPAVAFDAKATVDTAAGATPTSPLTVANLTIGPSATCLVATTSISVLSGTLPVCTGMTWNGVAMSLIGKSQMSDNTGIVYVFGLVNPATGNHTLSAAYTGIITNTNIYLDCASFSGSNRTSFTECFPPASVLTDVSTPAGTSYPTVAFSVPTLGGDCAVGSIQCTGVGYTGIATGTLIRADSSLNGNDTWGYNSATGATTSIQFTASAGGSAASGVAFNIATPGLDDPPPQPRLIRSRPRPIGLTAPLIGASLPTVTTSNGTLSITEAADTLSAAGTVLVTGTATPTEAGDTLASAGTILVTGTLNVTEAGDTLSSSGAVLVTGTLNVTEAADTLSATGTNGHVGALTITEADDTLSAAGTVLVTGTLNLTEAGDALSSAGTILVTGSLAVTEAGDTIASAGTVLVTGTLSVTEAPDTLSDTGTVLVTGTLNVVEDADTLSAAGTSTGASTGTLTQTEADDTLTSAGTVAITGTLIKTEADDVLASAGIATQAPPVTPPAPTGGGGGVGRLAGPKEYVYDEYANKKPPKPKVAARKGTVVAREAPDVLVATGTVSWDDYDDEFMAVMMMAA